jgi:hypothetical protein
MMICRETPISKVKIDRFFDLLKEYIGAGLVDLKSQLFDEIEIFVHQDFLPEQSKMCVNFFCPRISRSPAQCIFSKDTPKVDVGKCQTFWSGKFKVQNLPIKEVARQLTLWSSGKYCAIQRSELHNCPWEKPQLRYKCPNFVAFTEHYHRVSQCVEHRVLRLCLFEDRVKQLEYFIVLGQTLFELGNYHDLSAVVSAFESNSLNR